MDNVTPNKIQRLMHLAEDRSFNMPTRLLLNDEDVKRLTASQASNSKSSANYESSSSILDLNKVEGLGESGMNNEISLSKSTAFNPGEMTGRSTGTEEMNSRPTGPTSSKVFEGFGRHSLVLDSITSQMDKQTSEVEDIMRHSIASNYTFHSKRDLTADEASLIIREAPLPVQPGTQTQMIIVDNSTLNNSNMSMGTYFQNRCPDFGKILCKTDSPDRIRPSISEVSSSTAIDFAAKETNLYKMDQSLDSVPVKQPRKSIEKVPDNRVMNNLEKQNNYDLASKKNLFKQMPKDESKGFHKMGQSSNVQNPAMTSQKSFMNVASVNPTDVLLRNLQASLRITTDDTEGSVENSFSLSKIAEYLGKQSNVSVTEMLQNHSKKPNRKSPLTELHMNTQNKIVEQNMHVAYLKDHKNKPEGSSSGSVNTVICVDNLKAHSELKADKEVPGIVVTQHTIGRIDAISEVDSKTRSTRSKSPSSKSQSTLSTVHEKYPSFRSGDSPMRSSQGKVNTSHIPSPNIEYTELDKSVDWREVLLQTRPRQERLATEQWVEIVSTAAKGFVGVSCPVIISVTTLTDCWLTAKFQFDELPNNGQDLTVELPRLPFLLSPKKTEQITVYITSTTEIDMKLPFTMYIKDVSIDGDVQQKGTIDVNIQLPEIQAMSYDGVNKVSFPATVEKACVCKSFVLLSGSPVDLLLDLSIGEGDGMFCIKNVQEVKKSDINKVLLDRQAFTEERFARGKHKVTNKQLCKLSNGNGMKVTIAFNSPKLSELQIQEKLATLSGSLNVSLIGVERVLRKIELVGTVGTMNLVAEIPDKTLRLSKEPTSVTFRNSGTIPGVWVVVENDLPIRISPNKLDIRPGLTMSASFTYTGPDDSVCESYIVFEETNTGVQTKIDVVGGMKVPKTFPIKTNHSFLSWVRPGRKELSLKNSSNSKIHVKCQIIGDGFSIDLPGTENRGTYLLPFGPMECRSLPIIFNPNNFIPQSATLHVVYDKNSNVSRKVPLYGCAGQSSTQWSVLVTYGDTALIRAAPRSAVPLPVVNRASSPAFISVVVHFNLQYMCVANSARVIGGRHVIPPRSNHTISLVVDWNRVERRTRAGVGSTALATLTAITGAEFTRRRILRIIRDETTGKLDTSLLPDHLKMLAKEFEGEDERMDNYLVDFNETKESLNELISGLQELRAQIDLPQDFCEDNTIVINDDTVMEHHTLCD